MTLREIKESISNNTFVQSSIIFECPDNTFIPCQYIKELKKNCGYKIEYIESLDEVLPPQDDIFASATEPQEVGVLRVLNTSNFCEGTQILKEVNNVIVITKIVDKYTKNMYNDIVINIPKLEEWQIKDYVYSLGKGIDTKYLDWLMQQCKEDIYRLDNELAKVHIFDVNERKYVFDDMVEENAFSDLTTNTVFNFTNAILKKDIATLKVIYEELENMDVSDFGLLTILYNNFLNVVNIQLGINPTAESLGMKPNQFNAIKYNCGHYSKQSLINIMKFLTDIDRKIKTGQLDTKILIDYLVLSILSS